MLKFFFNYKLLDLTNLLFSFCLPSSHQPLTSIFPLFPFWLPHPQSSQPSLPPHFPISFPSFPVKKKTPVEYSGLRPSNKIRIGDRGVFLGEIPLPPPCSLV